MTDTSDTGPHSTQEMQDQLRLLAGKFLLRTRNHVTQLRQLIEALASGREPLTQIEEIAHKIHGSGAMFGFAEVSACGGEIELLAEASDPVDATTVARLNTLVDQLERAVQAVMDTR